MRWNGTFEYLKPPAATRNTDGFLIENSSSGWQQGGLCQVEIVNPAKHYIGEDGQKFTFSYEVYIEVKWKSYLSMGDSIQLNFDGAAIQTKILGIDKTDKRHLVVWA